MWAKKFLSVRSLRMKVKELIEKLQQMDPEALVLHRGYEDGYDVAGDQPEETFVVRNLRAEWYNGLYEIADYAEEYEEVYDHKNPIKAVII